ncbi:MAG: hypothetical protein Q4G08_08965 [Capnocytophaga sp.]|nr:hypothetical protein [Capnocytophaga sp.]
MRKILFTLVLGVGAFLLTSSNSVQAGTPNGEILDECSSITEKAIEKARKRGDSDGQISRKAADTFDKCMKLLDD